jgi:hypothetical protein
MLKDPRRLGPRVAGILIGGRPGPALPRRQVIYGREIGHVQAGLGDDRSSSRAWGSRPGSPRTLCRGRNRRAQVMRTADVLRFSDNCSRSMPCPPPWACSASSVCLLDRGRHTLRGERTRRARSGLELQRQSAFRLGIGGTCPQHSTGRSVAVCAHLASVDADTVPPGPFILGSRWSGGGRCR